MIQARPMSQQTISEICDRLGVDVASVPCGYGGYDLIALLYAVVEHQKKEIDALNAKVEALRDAIGRLRNPDDD